MNGKITDNFVLAKTFFANFQQFDVKNVFEK